MRAVPTADLRLTHPDLDFYVDGEDPRDVGVGATSQEAVREALRSLGEPYASEMSENLIG